LRSLRDRVLPRPIINLKPLERQLQCLRQEIHQAQILGAQTLIRQLRTGAAPNNIADAEFRVCSQFGDDGIIQFLIHHIEDVPQSFIEFGVGNYSEANTRFLLENNNWKGLIIDSDTAAMKSLSRQDLYWKYDLTAVGAFITTENINQLFKSNGFTGAIGLLSIDVDGNDYWIWEAITSVDPVIVIVEYNSLFGDQRAVTIPYDAQFERGNAHHSHLYYGCSLKALCVLANQNQYAFIGANSNGNNAYFVKRDRLNGLPEIDVTDGFVASMVRESRNEHGQLTFLSGDDRLDEISAMPLVDLETDQTILVKDL